LTPIGRRDEIRPVRITPLTRYLKTSFLFFIILISMRVRIDQMGKPASLVKLAGPKRRSDINQEPTGGALGVGDSIRPGAPLRPQLIPGPLQSSFSSEV
jgi:hypothetical protein